MTYWKTHVNNCLSTSTHFCSQLLRISSLLWARACTVFDTHFLLSARMLSDPSFVMSFKIIIIINAKSVGFWDTAPDPNAGTYSTPLSPLAGWAGGVPRWLGVRGTPLPHLPHDDYQSSSPPLLNFSLRLCT